MQRAHYFDFFIANTVSAQVRRRFHCNETKELEQVVLHHVAQGACCFVKASARPDAECFRRCDLHMIDVMRVPKRREDGVRESEDEDILCRFLSEEMIDPVGLFFGKGMADDTIKLAC